MLGIQRSGVGGGYNSCRGDPPVRLLISGSFLVFVSTEKNNKKIQIRGIQTALLLMQPYKVAAATGEEKSEKSESGRKPSVRSSYIRLLCL